MKKFWKHLPKKLVAGVAILAIVIGVTVPALASPEPTGPSRPTRAWTPQENGFDHVTFDSYTGVPNGIGDEPDFFRGVQTGQDPTWTDPVQNVAAGAEVQGKIYIHNNADPLLNSVPDGNGSFKGVAHNVTVKVSIPTAVSQTQELTADISASNATPNDISDTLDVTGPTAFGLQYEMGTAEVHNQDGTVTDLTTAQEQALISGGYNMGDQNGCFQFVREITFKMKVGVPSYTLTKSVRFPGQTADDWKKSVTTTPGSIVEWKLEFDNTGVSQLGDVILLDQLPSDVTVVPGSVKQVDGNFPTGFVEPPEAVQNNGTQINVDVGKVNGGINSILAFETTVNNSTDLQCGNHTLVNTGYATPEGFGTIKDTASVVVQGSGICQTPTPVYTCNLLDVSTGSNRTITVTKLDTTASGGAVFNNAVIDWGDKTTPLTTNNAVGQTHQYAADGTYTIVATAHFTVNGQDVTASGASCTKSVSFTTPPTPVTLLSATPPTKLVDTGPGSTIALFAGVTVAGAVAYRFFLGRRLARGKL